MYMFESPAVLYSADPVAKVAMRDARMLMQSLAENPALRSTRLCTHKNIDAPLHQMFIVHRKGTYIRPHMHVGREMLVTLFSGEMSVIIFSAHGDIEEVIHMGDFLSEKCFFCSIPAGKYFSQVIKSKHAFLGETLLGPFRPSNVMYADFAPDVDTDTAGAYLAVLTEVSRKWRAD